MVYFNLHGYGVFKIILSCIPLCNHMVGVSFCSLTNRYWSDSKMTSISYNYNTEYTTK